MLSDKVRSMLKEMKKDYQDLILMPTMMMAFIEEKSLTDEFQTWVEENEDEIRKELN